MPLTGLGGAGVVELEGGVVAAAAESALDGGGETVRGELGGEEAGLGRAAEGTAAGEGRECADGDAGEVGVDGGSGVVAGEGLLDERGEIGVAAAEEEMGEGLILHFESRGPGCGRRVS